MKQILKYGLLRPLRSFEVPQVWKQPLALAIHGPLVEEEKKGTKQCFRVPRGTEGTITLDQHCKGNEQNTIHITVEPQCKVQFFDSLQGNGTLSRTVRLEVQEHSTVKYNIPQAMDADAQAIIHYRGEAENAELHWLCCAFGAQTTQASIYTTAGSNVQTTNTILVLGNSKQQFDMHAHAIHRGTQSKSNMLTRCILDDEARAISHGLIHIDPQAAECDSYQKNETLLLGPQAAADAIPNLEILNSAVRCSHGATIGKLDEEKLFYFQSRGIAQAQAKTLITEGFLLPLIPPPWQPTILKRISPSSKAE